MNLDDVDEGLDNTLLNVLLKQRIDGLTSAQAAAQISKDRDELQSWVAEKPEHPAYFIVGYLSEPKQLAGFLRKFAPPEDWRPPRATAKRKTSRAAIPASRAKVVSIAVPPEFDVWTEGRTTHIQKGKHKFEIRRWVGRISLDDFKEAQESAELDHLDPMWRESFQPVSFGVVTGYRIVRAGRVLSYGLKVGRKEFIVGVNAGSHRIIEPFLHTITYG
jgi:hypothetical protein